MPANGGSGTAPVATVPVSAPLTTFATSVLPPKKTVAPVTNDNGDDDSDNDDNEDDD